MNTENRPKVAYFCMEYGLDPSLAIYAGGLGILAGDHMKSVGDLHLPVIGIGVLWDQGYSEQFINAAGRPAVRYAKTNREDLERLDVEVKVRIRGKKVPCRAYRVRRHTAATLYLLEPSRRRHRWISRNLYGGGEEFRLAQELVLGVGGVRLLRKLGIDVDVYHFNEGHAVFAGFELVREAREKGASFDEALRWVGERIVFTTHTPVPAGNEMHEIGVMRRMGACLDLSDEEVSRIGGSPFSMTVAGLRLARSANAVAKLHGETAREMWKHVEGGAPIASITNGVHARTWQDARIRAANVPDKAAGRRRSELWGAHQEMKRELLEAIRERTGSSLREDRLLIGFARRAAPYKRASLFFSDEANVKSLFRDSRVQIVFASKAHPDDERGRKIVGKLVEASRRWPQNVVFLENYDMRLGALLTRGCDIWLNNPRRPMEASGTSGMKAAMNGVLNVSILDGWWPEGCRNGETGWQIGRAPEPGDKPLSTTKQDARDADALYRVLTSEVLPRYYEGRDQWVGMMQKSIAMAQWRFSSDRMVEDYFRSLYAAPSAD